MESRRSFIVFVFIRFLAWGTAAFLVAVLLGALGVIDSIPLNAIIPLGILGFVTSFFDFDSVPRKIEIRETELILVDPSGEEIVLHEFAVRRFLWLTRIVVCRNRKVVSIPLEAFKSTSKLTKLARGGLQKRAEQASDGKPDTVAS